MLEVSGLGMGMDSSQSELLISSTGLQPLTIPSVEPLDPGALSPCPHLYHAEHLHPLSLAAQAYTLLLGTRGI